MGFVAFSSIKSQNFGVFILALLTFNSELISLALSLATDIIIEGVSILMDSPTGKCLDKAFVTVSMTLELFDDASVT